MLKEMQGRTTDFAIAEIGTVVMRALALVYNVRDVAGINQFKERAGEPGADA